MSDGVGGRLVFTYYFDSGSKSRSVMCREDHGRDYYL
jgi:hypothetical protein